MVCVSLAGFRVRCARPPAASATIMVSPIARVMARKKLAMMPLSAAGTTTRTLTSKRVPPSA